MGSGGAYRVRSGGAYRGGKVLWGQEGLMGSGQEGLTWSRRSYGVRKDLQGQEGLRVRKGL